MTPSGNTIDGKPPKQSSSLLVNLLIFTGVFNFYFIFVFQSLPQAFTSSDLMITQIIFLVAVVSTIFLASHVTKGLRKKHIVIFSLALMATLLSLLTPIAFPYVLLPTALSGIFFGISQLAFYKTFWISTESAERSKIASLIGFVSVTFFFIINIISSSAFNFFENIALCILLIACTTLGGLFAKKETYYNSSTKKMVYYPEKRTIILYAVPWILFSFLNVTLTKNITVVASVLSSSTMYLLLSSSQIVGGIIGALAGGYFADRIGRRITLISSVALYGVSMAFRGFTDNGIALLFSFIGEGLTWGVFLVLYSFVIWGDLANTRNAEKIYGIGLVAFNSAEIINVLKLFTGFSVVNSTLISCILIFLAIIPIVLAPELLTSETQEKKRLKKYMETVRKIADESE